MKNRILAILLVLGLVLCGCAKQDNEKTSVEKEPEKKTEIVDQENTDENTDTAESIPMDQKITLADVNSETCFFVVDDAFEGKSDCTLQDFIEGVATITGIGTDSEVEVEKTSIDCGSDGEKEILLSIDFYSTGYRLLCVATEETDVYNMRYMIDQGQLDDVSIDDQGRVNKSISVESGVRNYVCGHLDESYNNIFEYGYNYYLAASAFDKLEVSGDNWDDVQVREYYFTSDGEGEKYCTVEAFDDAIDSATLYDKTGKYYQAFEKAGLTLYTQDEIDKMIKK